MWAHLRLSARALKRAPTFTLLAVATLALGIGANTAIFSVIEGVLLRPVPFEAVDRLQMVWETDRNSGTTREPASVPDLLDFQERTTQFEALAALMGSQRNAVTETGEPIRLTSLAVTSNLLPLLGVGGVTGRTFTTDEDDPGAAPVALISEGVGRRLFDGDADILGRALTLDEVPHTIVGVIPTGADLGVLQMLSAAAYARAFADRGTRTDVDVWVPLPLDPQTFPRYTHPILVVGRLIPTATISSAQDELTRIAADLERDYPENDGRGVFVEPLTAVVFGPTRPALLVLLVAVTLVLFVACANVANLILVRSATREREVAVRQALGANARHLAGQFLTEGVLLAGLATVAGVTLAHLGLDALIAQAPPDVPRLDTVTVDGRVLTVTVGVAIAVGLFLGLLPLTRMRHRDLQTALKARSTAARVLGRHRAGPRLALTVTQVALAVVLVVGAGLTVRSFWQLLSLDTGFETGGVIKAEYQLPDTRYPVNMAGWPDFQEAHRFTQTLLQRVSTVPGVRSAAVSGNHPLDAGATNSFVVVGREAEASAWPEISVRRVTPSYFETVGLRLLRGRPVESSDDARAAPVALINNTAARRFFGDDDPLGHQLGFWGSARTIVGVVQDERFLGIDRDPPVAVYLPLAQAPSIDRSYALMARTDTDPRSLASTIPSLVREIDPALAVYGVEPLGETVTRSVGQRRFVLLLLAAFAATAVGLAMVGLYGALSYEVTQRTKEIGIRMALGAHPNQVLRQILREGLALTVVGLAVGLAAALVWGRSLAALLYGVGTFDPLTFLTVPVLVLSVAAAACYLPARRAALVDPMRTLRVE